MIALNAPMRYLQKPGMLQEIGSVLKKWEKIFVIADPFVLEHYSSILKKSFSENGITDILIPSEGICSRQRLCHWAERVKTEECHGVLGIGGGKALDMAKATAFFAGVPMAAAPTAASTDAPCSGLAVLYQENGELDQYLHLDHSPEFVLVDSQVIFSAPAKFLRAGIGDALSTYYEARACMRSGGESDSGSVGSASGLLIAKACRDVIFSYGVEALHDQERGKLTPAFEHVIEANLYLSGLGFENGGLAAAHGIHNAMNRLSLGREFLHGEKVAFGTLVQLLLEKDEEEYQKVLSFCRKAGLPISLEDLNVSADQSKRLSEMCLLEKDFLHLPFLPSKEEIDSALLRAGK